MFNQPKDYTKLGRETTRNTISNTNTINAPPNKKGGVVKIIIGIIVLITLIITLVVVGTSIKKQNTYYSDGDEININDITLDEKDTGIKIKDVPLIIDQTKLEDIPITVYNSKVDVEQDKATQALVYSKNQDTLGLPNVTKRYDLYYDSTAGAFDDEFITQMQMKKLGEIVYAKDGKLLPPDISQIASLYTDDNNTIKAVYIDSKVKISNNDSIITSKIPFNIYTKENYHTDVTFKAFSDIVKKSDNGLTCVHDDDEITGEYDYLALLICLKGNEPAIIKSYELSQGVVIFY